MSHHQVEVFQQIMTPEKLSEQEVKILGLIQVTPLWEVTVMQVKNL